jgi:hypothetical protein
LFGISRLPSLRRNSLVTFHNLSSPVDQAAVKQKKQTHLPASDKADLALAQNTRQLSLQEVSLVETTFDYLRLCSAPHKRRYVAMSVMLS